MTGKGDEIRCNDCENEGILLDRGSRVEIPIIRNAARSTVGTPISSFNQSRSFVPDLHAASNLSLILIGIGSSIPLLRGISFEEVIPHCLASRILKVRVHWILRTYKHILEWRILPHWSESNIFAKTNSS